MPPICQRGKNVTLPLEEKERSNAGWLCAKWQHEWLCRRLDWLYVLAQLIFWERCRLCQWRAGGQTQRASFRLASFRLASLCPSCFAEMEAKDRFSLDKIELSSGVVIHVATACRYRGKVRTLLHRLKYKGDRLIACDLAWLLPPLLPLFGKLAGSQLLIVPVPLHGNRLAERKYNQASLLAACLAQKTTLPFTDSALMRVRHTAPQWGLAKAQRRENVAKAFAASACLVQGKVIVLVDDVFTSGATLGEASVALLEAGAQQVVAVAVARAELGERPGTVACPKARAASGQESGGRRFQAFLDGGKRLVNIFFGVNQ